MGSLAPIGALALGVRLLAFGLVTGAAALTAPPLTSTPPACRP